MDLNNSHEHIGKHLVIYEDTTASLDFEQIIKLPKSSFFQINNDAFSNTFSSSAFWYRFELKNTKNTPIDKLFVIEPAWLDYLQINIISPKGEKKQYEVGNTFNYSQRTIDSYVINQSHSFEPGNSIVYIKMKTRDPFVFILSILDDKTFLTDQNKEFLFIGLLFGVLFGMIFYNLFLFFGIRQPYYAYYILFVTSFIIMNSSYNGYTFKLFFAEHNQIQNWIQGSSIFFYMFAALLFAKSFLDLKIRHPKLYKSTNYLIFILIFTAILSALLGGYKHHVILSIVFNIIVSFYIISTAIYSWIHSNPTARFFILGTISGLIGITITSLTVMGLIPYSQIGFKAVDIGNVPIEEKKVDENLKEIQNFVDKIYSQNDSVKLIMIGGYHFCSFPVVKAVGDHYSNKESFGVLLFDAHLDFYQEWDKGVYSHATVSHRIYDLDFINNEL